VCDQRRIAAGMVALSFAVARQSKRSPVARQAPIPVEQVIDLGRPVAHRPPPHPRQALTHRRAQVGLVEEPGRLAC
jgi:hypothetical protein